MDLEKILPATETIRRFLERIAALYEPSQKRNMSHRYKKTASDRDISEYLVNESAPTEAYFSDTLAHLLSLAAHKPDVRARMQRYIGQWSRWTKLGLTTIKEFETCVQTLLPGLYSCWKPSAKR